jgi:hypothetical protein
MNPTKSPAKPQSRVVEKEGEEKADNPMLKPMIVFAPKLKRGVIV